MVAYGHVLVVGNSAVCRGEKTRREHEPGMVGWAAIPIILAEAGGLQ